MTDSAKADVVEIFSSLQGEGMLVGLPQLFIRFAGCNLHCAYCDTESARIPGAECQVEMTPGSGDFVQHPNPLSVDRVTAIVLSRLETSCPCHSLAFTGGEPLLHTRFLSPLLSALAGRIPTYLETNGTLWGQLEGVVDRLDMISMDMKLPSATGEAADWEAHRRFLAVGGGGIVQIKLTFGDLPDESELQRAVDLVADADPGIPLVLQPVHGMERPVGWVHHLLTLQARCMEKLETVRVIPQTHKLLKIH
ncbi:MAG: 7-carboxy-7-deazaguanine synthase QueE [bacterium]|nr:7-carboxy-7-deazaguanine synthase QueE [bacterium]